jgi:hypothetical protein
MVSFDGPTRDYDGPPTEDMPVKQSRFNSEAEMLDAALQELQNVVKHLVGRLAPVLSPTEEKTMVSGKEGYDLSSPLTDYLHSKKMDVVEMIEALKDVHGRLEI